MNRNSLDLLVSPDENKIKIEISPFYRKDILESREYLICLLLKNLRSFNKLITNSRDELGLTNPLELPLNQNLENLTKIKFDLLDEDGRSKLNINVKQICDKYSLTDNWYFSLEILILTNHLPIPFREYAINFYLPEKNTNKNALLSSIYLSHQRELITHPALYFTSKISPTELISWLEKNKKLITLMLKDLPEKTSVGSRLNIRTERVATVAIIFKQEGLNDWAKMEKEILRWSNNSEDDFTDFFGDDGIPTAEELRLSFKSYINVITKLDSPESS